MINFQFRTTGGSYYPQFRVQKLSDALDACLFVLCDLESISNWYVALSSMNNDRQNFPNIHIQALNSDFFLQVFATVENSPNGEEGWFTLFEDQNALGCEPLSLTDEVCEGDQEKFFEAAFAQGISFNKSFFVSRQTVIDHIKRFSITERGEWVNNHKWLNLGLI